MGLTGPHSGLIALLVLIAAVPVNLYPIFYAFRPWESTSQGRALMIKSLGNMILIDMIVAFQWFGEYRGHTTIRIIGMSLFIVGICYLFWSLLTSPGARDYPPFQWRYLFEKEERRMTAAEGGGLPVGPEVVKADPKRPYKAIAGAIITLLGLVWANVQASPHPLNTVGDWLSVTIPAVITFGVVYGVTNPKVLVTQAKEE